MPTRKLFYRMAAVIMGCTPISVQAQVVEGPAEALDGDSLRVGATEIRLFGVDAPELSQSCYDNGTVVACGMMAKQVLDGMIDGASLTCVAKDTDTHGRIVAVCRTAGVDIGGALVEAGWATAFRLYADDYVAAEYRAQASRVGIWQWNFQLPEEYRTRQRSDIIKRAGTGSATGASAQPRRFEQNGQCLIKGNQSRRGEWIYHLPGMPYYGATRAEAWFCTEQQAREAGYRRALVR